MRLYPPAPQVARVAQQPCQLGEFHAPAGTTFLISQWVVHRDPRYFADPETFSPERWLGGLALFDEQLPEVCEVPAPQGQGFARAKPAVGEDEDKERDCERGEQERPSHALHIPCVGRPQSGSAPGFTHPKPRPYRSVTLLVLAR